MLLRASKAHSCARIKSICASATGLTGHEVALEMMTLAA
jgi:hypothetical protein